MTNRFGYPFLGYGMGLRSKHYQDILDHWPNIDWLEIISENYMDTDGRPKRILEQVIEHYPVVMHGVSLSIGSTDPLDKTYLKKLKALADWVNPPWISDHLCWTGVNEKNSHDLLPVPYTEKSLAYIIDRIKEVQDYLGRTILLENPSTYLEFQESSIPEWEFIARMAEEADCGLLLDVNNVYVSCYNHRLDARTYLDAIPGDRVVQIHLAGHENLGTHIVDTHDGQVIDEVWDLYSYAISRIGKTTTMIEWDAKIPEFSVLQAEVEKIRQYAERTVELQSTYNHNQAASYQKPNVTDYPDMLTNMQEAILSGDVEEAKPEEWIRPKKDFAPDDQLSVYVKGYRYRLFDVVSEDYETTRKALGDEEMNSLIRSYIEHTPSQFFNISRYVDGFPAFIKGKVSDFIYELACLEAQLTNVFDRTETVPLSAEAFSSIEPEQFFALRLPVREACVLLEFHYPVNAYYTDVNEEKDAIIPSEPSSSYLAVFRHEDTVWRMELEKGEYDILSCLQQGNTVEEAVETALDDTQEGEQEIIASLQNWFGRWVRNSLLAEVPLRKAA